MWGTTPAFLAQFGLNDLRDMPKREELLIDPTGPALKEQAPVLSPRVEAEAGAEAEAESAIDSGDSSVDSGKTPENTPPEEEPAP